MNIGLLVVVTLAVLLVVLLAVPRLRKIAAIDETPVERRCGVDRRRESIPVPIERRRRVRRSDDIDRELADALS